jgi:hypothetical protein
LQNGLRDAIAPALAELDQIERDRRRILGCDGPAPEPACHVELRYLQQVGRAAAPAEVYASIILGFEAAKRDKRVVGINIVAPEDGPIATRDYRLHMRMFQTLHAIDPGVKLSLHAGEVTLGLVPPEELTYRIGEAVRTAGALRIGHGVDIASENGADALLARMHRDGILVEIALTSNDAILGVRGARHPLPLYLARGVPVTLVTDDEGVNRSDLTNEYERAVETYGFGLDTIERFARNGIEYGFVEGASLWRSRTYDAYAAPCAGAIPAGAPPARCVAYLRANTKAALEWDLETDLARFERRLATSAPGSV